MRTALIIVISVKDKDDLSLLIIGLLSGQVLKSFPTLSLVLNYLHLFFLIKID